MSSFAAYRYKAFFFKQMNTIPFLLLSNAFQLASHPRVSHHSSEVHGPISLRITVTLLQENPPPPASMFSNVFFACCFVNAKDLEYPPLNPPIQKREIQEELTLLSQIELRTHSYSGAIASIISLDFRAISLNSSSDMAPAS